MPFTQGYTYRRNGFLISFLMNCKYLGVDKPENYNVDKLEETVDETLEDALLSGEDDIPVTAPVDGQQPNIIVIMNEAFSDLSVLGDLETNKDYMPYFRSLTENTISGTVYVSVLGGNTANSEFEFLTGDSMAFLPTGSIPYQQYIKSEIPTLVDVLNDQGYYSIAMHPYYASGWERDKVYDWMGFDQKYFINDFSGAQRLRQYVSDWGMYQKIISTYKEYQQLSKKDQPLFYFGVTMQNHSGYSKEYENFSNDVHVISDSGKEYKYADTYLSLIAESDRAYEKLIHYFTYIEEPTIILMFGDHQPHSMEISFFEELLGKHPLELNLEETVLRYQTPFKIWANYDIEEQSDVAISLNYLSTLLMKTAGLELSEYQDYLWEVYEQLPIVTSNFYMDNDGNIYDYGSDRSVPAYEDLLDDYSSLQYNHLFDEANRLAELFVLPEDTIS
ncbi:MAG: LTA synthase family protein, partial [Lachnospiraceae bacterium]|nr:LTA synthase family protein [Lachnospiraceae bacterium]